MSIVVVMRRRRSWVLSLLVSIVFFWFMMSLYRMLESTDREVENVSNRKFVTFCVLFLFSFKGATGFFNGPIKTFLQDLSRLQVDPSPGCQLAKEIKDGANGIQVSLTC